MFAAATCWNRQNKMCFRVSQQRSKQHNFLVNTLIRESLEIASCVLDNLSWSNITFQSLEINCHSFVTKLGLNAKCFRNWKGNVCEYNGFWFNFMPTWAVSRRNFYLLPKASRVLTLFGWNRSGSSTAIRTVDTREAPHKRVSHQLSAAGRRCRAQVCSLAQVNKRKTGAIWQTCRAWNSFLMFTLFTLELLQRHVAWLRLAFDNLQTISVMLNRRSVCHVAPLSHNEKYIFSCRF